MRTITGLKRQKKNKERINVYLDGEFAFGLNEFDAASLRKGQQLSDIEIAELRHKDLIVKAVDKGAELLSYRPRSKQEIRRKLADKEYPEAVITASIERMERLGYLDDRAFARFWIESRNRHKPRGERALRYELRGKGVPDSIIGELLDEMVDEQSAAYTAAQSRVRRMQGSTQQVFKKKIGAFLQRRGFSYEAANRALDRLIDETQSTDPAFFAEDDS